MNDAINLSKKINECIKESEEYNNYLRTKNNLRQRPDLLIGLKEFEARNTMLQNNTGLDNPFDEVNNLFLEYDGLLHETTVNEFSRAEQKLSRLMKKVYDSIADGLEIGAAWDEDR